MLYQGCLGPHPVRSCSQTSPLRGEVKATSLSRTRARGRQPFAIDWRPYRILARHPWRAFLWSIDPFEDKDCGDVRSAAAVACRLESGWTFIDSGAAEVPD